MKWKEEGTYFINNKLIDAELFCGIEIFGVVYTSNYYGCYIIL